MSLLQDADPHFLDEMTALLHGDLTDPHAFLGLHPFYKEGQVIRLYRPGAAQIYLEVKGHLVTARRLHEKGLFDCFVDKQLQPRDYRVYYQNGLLAADPYSFSPSFGEVDAHLFNQGTHYKLYDQMGAHLIEHEGIRGVRFTVWAPHAQRVSVVGDFNFWDGRVNPMRSIGSSGVWELFVPALEEKERYKFEIKTEMGEILLKSDPFANGAEFRPKTASIVSCCDSYQWNDREWIENRENCAADPQPLNIYEVHLGSWKKPHEHFLNYRDLAHQLAAYCTEMGYTHVELMGILEHPLDESWGYQVTGFFAVTSRFGTVQDFQYMVDHLHQQGIGVLLDWVPGHFPSDDFSLARFDGTALYEHEDPRQGYHPHWNTLIFNYGRYEVSNFLIASALFWIDKMHLDGLRVDAVASMLYLDYGREEGNWIPNQYGGKENIDAIEFLKHLNSVIHKEYPGIMTIAEESTSFPNVTKPVDWEGLGFDYKWNMGWMHDSLRYFHKDPLYRKYHHNDLTFGLLYAFSERFILPLSHDEVVHGKRSLLSKMPGEYEEQFANLRLLLSYQICQPGKKMLFMGGEFGQWDEWSEKRELHWHLLQYPTHSGLQTLVKELNHFYLQRRELWERDDDLQGFEWVDFSDSDQSIISYFRRGKGESQLLCVHNFTPTMHPEYLLPVQGLKGGQEVFTTDVERYGGSGVHNADPKISDDGLTVRLAPLATHIFALSFT